MKTETSTRQKVDVLCADCLDFTTITVRRNDVLNTAGAECAHCGFLFDEDAVVNKAVKQEDEAVVS